MLEVVQLRCEYFENPIGIDEPQPRLSWQLRSVRRGAHQTAWRVRVATDPDRLVRGEADLWDSGRVEDGRTTQIAYAGKPLVSDQRCWWVVRSWDESGCTSEWSEPAMWSMGILQPQEWTADWVGGDELHAAPLLRGCLELTGAVRHAQLHITALGLFEAYLNGRRVGQDCLTPGWTDYGRRLHYFTYDVTALLQTGENVLGAMLAPGWFRGFISPESRNDYYGGAPTALRAQLHVELTSGERVKFGTNAEWQTAEGPILMAELLHGEVYDARREIPGWCQPRFDERGWAPVQLRPAYQGKLHRHMGNPVQVLRELTAVGVSEHRAGAYIFDFGQNISGWVRIRINEHCGKRIVLRFAEVMDADGSLSVRNLRRAQAMDMYYAHGKGEEVWAPRFTYHGFRYIEIEGLDTQQGDHPLYCNRPPLDVVTAVAISSALPVTGRFTCSDPLVNQLASNIQWSLHGNFIDIPTDCPQRDERLGWTGDIAAFVGTANYLCHTAAFLSKWMNDVADAQHADGCVPNVVPNIEYFGAGVSGWGDAIVICPWEVYRTYGDERILRRHYLVMARWIAWLEAHSRDGLRPDEGLGDWLAIGANTPRDLIATAFFGYSVSLMSKIARLLGHAEDADRYAQRFGQIQQAFIRTYVDEATGTIAGQTQTGYLLALDMGLIEGALAERAFARLAENVEALGRISTGFLGVQHINPVLTRMGRGDLAWSLLLNRECPSWLYAVEQGATTIWERWDAWTPEQGYHPGHMNSFNHYAFGSIGEWLFSGVAGIQAEQPGFRAVTIRPEPSHQWRYAEARFDSVHGPILSRWELSQDTLTMLVRLPAGTQGHVHVPRDAGTIVHEGEVRAEAAQGVKLVRQNAQRAVFAIASGTYCFKSTFSRAATEQVEQRQGEGMLADR